MLMHFTSDCQVVKKEYEREQRAVLGPKQLVEFESDSISLDISMTGISVKGWTITPLVRPVVSSVNTLCIHHVNQLPSIHVR